MRKNFLHIIFCLTMTFAVTDYLWVELFFSDDKIVAELEGEMEKEGSKEEVREGRPLEERLDPFILAWSNFTYAQIALSPVFSGFIRHGNSYSPSQKNEHPKLFLLHQQFKIPC